MKPRFTINRTINGLLVLLALALLPIFLLPRQNTPANIPTIQWSPEAQRDAQTKGPVFVDFTADWCITCKVTEATVLHTAKVQELFPTLLAAPTDHEDGHSSEDFSPCKRLEGVKSKTT